MLFSKKSLQQFKTKDNYKIKHILNNFTFSVLFCLLDLVRVIKVRFYVPFFLLLFLYQRFAQRICYAILYTLGLSDSL
jgi:hypothetical protein